MVLALFLHNGKICNGPNSVSPMGKLAMILALFHSGRVCNDPGSVSQWKSLQ